MIDVEFDSTIPNRGICVMGEEIILFRTGTETLSQPQLSPLELAYAEINKGRKEIKKLEARLEVAEHEIYLRNKNDEN